MISENGNPNSINEKIFLENYWNIYKKLLFESDINSDLIAVKNLLRETNKKGGKVIFVGNGASASLSSHAATDLTKQAKIQSIALNDHNLITALANDYGYENWVSNGLSYYANEKDLLVLFSVSGESLNLINAVKFAKKIKMKTLSFTGCNIDNNLRRETDFSLWVDCNSYNIVESIHTIWITLIIDLIVGKISYPVN